MEDWGVSLPLPMPAEVPHIQPTCNTSGAATVKPLYSSLPLYSCSCICSAGLGLGILTNRALSLCCSLATGNSHHKCSQSAVRNLIILPEKQCNIYYSWQCALCPVPCCRGELITKSNRRSSLLWTDCFEREERYWMDG